MQLRKPIFSETEQAEIDRLMKQMDEQSKHLQNIKDGNDTDAIRAGKERLKITTVQLNNLLNKQAS